MFPKLAAFAASTQNRSFVKRSKERERTANVSFSGFSSLNRSSASGSSARNKVENKETPPRSVPVLRTTPTDTSDDDDSVCSEQSSFWNQWAEDLLQREEVEYRQNSPKEVLEKKEIATSQHGDPSFAVDASIDMMDALKSESRTLVKALKINDDSVVTGPVPEERDERIALVAGNEAEVENAEANDYINDNETETETEVLNLIDLNSSIDTMIAMNLSRFSVETMNFNNKYDAGVELSITETTVKTNRNQGTEKSDVPSQFVSLATSNNTSADMNLHQDTIGTDAHKTIKTDQECRMPVKAVGEGIHNTNVDRVSCQSLVNKNRAEEDIAADTSNHTSAEDPINSIYTELEVFSQHQALELSTKATKMLQAKNYVESLNLFQSAIDCYQKQQDRSILSPVNIAGCFRNMSAVSRMLERYDEAASYLRKAEKYYTHGREAFDVKNSETILTLDGKLLDDSQARDVSVSCYTGDDESMCLDAMLLETLQTRADFHVKYQDDIEQAAECHEQCLIHLIHLNKLNLWNEQEETDVVREQGVTFVQLSEDQHTAFLIKSLVSLGAYYRALASHSTFTACMVVFEDALDIVQSRQEREVPGNDALILSVAQILRYLSEIYFERKELDRAVDALHDSTAVKLTASGKPCPEALEVMDKMGAANEKMKNWQKARSCYEQSLFARCKYYGSTHIYVAKSLVNVARVMERERGSTEESVELYKAANAIFALKLSPESPELDEDVEAILRHIPTVIRQGQYEKAVNDLNKCLALTDDTSCGLILDKAQIYFDLGRAYIGMNDYAMATQSLSEAIRHVGGVDDKDLFSLLQHIEFLQRDKQKRPEKGGNTSTDKVGCVQDPTLSIRSITELSEKTTDEVGNAQDSNVSFRNITKELDSSTHRVGNFQDLIASFGNMTFQLQDEQSMHIFEDDWSTGKNQCNSIQPVITSQWNVTEEEKVEIEPNKTDLYLDILQQSFAREQDTYVPVATAPNVSNPKQPSRSKGNAKLANKVAALIIRLRRPRPKLMAKYKLSTMKLKKFRKKMINICQRKPIVECPDKPASFVPEKALDETVVYSSFERTPTTWETAVSDITSHCFPPLGDRDIAKSIDFFRRVVIEEESEGFSSQLVKSVLIEEEGLPSQQN